MTITPYRQTSSYGAAARERQAVAAATAKPRRGGRKKWRWTKKRIVFVILLPFLLVLLWLGIKFGFNAARIFNGNIFNIFSTTRLRGEDTGRVNFLLAGNSADDKGHNGANLTDSIMIFSLDTRNHKAFILSIPRDLYVNIDGYGYSKINKAYDFGEQEHFSENGYPRGGMGLLEKTINEYLGVKTQYYALINYAAMRDAVNAVGGVDVTIQSSNSRGLYDPSTDWATGGPLVKLTNGQHHLSGEQALDLARARGDAYGSYGYANSDFTRTENQRKLLVALKSKVFTTGTLANPITLSKLFDSLGRNVKTDMQLSEARRLYDLMKDVDNNQIKSYGLNDLKGKDYLKSYRTPRGESALIPAAGLDNFMDIQQAIRRLMSTNKVADEGANVVLLNATPAFGVAAKNETMLAGRNISVSQIADAQSESHYTYIIVPPGRHKPATLAALQAVYGTRTSTSNPYASQYKDADFIVILGDDRVASTAN